MIAQKILFPNPQTCVERDMFFRLGDGTEYTYAKDEVLFLRKFSVVFFNTYFNCFSIGKWSKYTTVDKVYLTLKLKGKFIVTLWREEQVLGRNQREIVYAEMVSSDRPKEFTFEYKSVQTTGLYYFCINSQEIFSVYYGGYYSVESSVPQRDVKIGIDICHYKKEPYIRRNMAAIDDFLAERPDFASHLEVFISDNSQTLTEKDLSYNFVHVFPNKNVGGSGGFTRGMLEIQKANDNGDNVTHALLMDDDLTFDPEVIYRTYVFLSYLKEKYNRYFFSGIMNRADKRNIQHEYGALWRGGDFVSLKGNFDMNNFDNVLFNDCVDENVEFAAWWYCAIPIELIINNLPLPIFYREDDAEFGMRNAEGVIAMNGICVWHEPFDSKFTPFVCYYHSRNLHIANALHHPEYGVKHLLDYTWREINVELRFMRYKIADLYLQAAEDFLKGINWLKNTDTVELHKQVNSGVYKMQPCEDIHEMPFVYGEYVQMCNKPNYPPKKMWLYKHVFNYGYRFMKSTRDVWVPIAPGKVRVEMFAYAKRAYHYDIDMKRGFVTERSKKEYKRIIKRYKNLEKLAKKNYDRVAEEYRKNLSEITSNEFWNKYLGI